MILLALVAASAGLQAQPIMTIHPRHRIVEGVAGDGETLWVSSLLDRKIMECRPGLCRTFAVPPAGLHPFAIAWDSDRSRLWVAADCPPNVAGIEPCERGALLGYDRKGKLRLRISASGGGAFHPGDVSTSAGGVFASDSQSGAVYRLSRDGKSLETLVGVGIGKSAQGSSLSSDGQTLIVADYSKGIAAIDLETKARTPLLREGDRPLRGIDGLVRCGSTFYGIYNGQAPGTLVAIRREGDRIAIHEPLPEGWLPDPTQVALVGNRLLIVSDSGWATLDKKDFVRNQGTPIYAIDLPEDCAPR